MGQGNLPPVNRSAEPALTDGLINRIIGALLGHLLPRDAAGNPDTNAADLGSIANAWRNLYLRGRVFINGEAVSLGGGASGGGGGNVAPGIKERIAGGYVLKGRATNDGAPSFLIPQGNAGVRIFGSNASPLKIIYKDGTARDITASLDVGLTNTRGQGAANTAQVDLPQAELAHIATRYFGLRAMGYGGTRTLLQAVGARWTQTQDEWFAFSPNESGGDMGVCRVINRGGFVFLTDCYRGFFGKRGVNADDYADGIIDALAGNATLHFANLNFIFVRKDGTAFAHGRNLHYAASPLLDRRVALAGDIRLNAQEGRWESAAIVGGVTAWNELDAVLVGVAVPNAAGGCDFARGVWDDAAIKLFASAPVFAGGRLASGDNTKWQPSFSPHNKLSAGGFVLSAEARAAIQTAVNNRLRQVPNAWFGSGLSSTEEGYAAAAADAAAAAAADAAAAAAAAAADAAAAAAAAEDVVLNPVLQVKFASPGGGGGVPFDWITTQCYRLMSPVSLDERYDDRGGGRPAPVEADISSLPDGDAAGTRRFIYSDSDFGGVVAENAVPPVMVECAGRQLFIHPHKTKTALAVALRGADGWEVSGITSGARAVVAGKVATLRENAGGQYFGLPLSCAYQLSAAAETFFNTQRGRAVVLKKLGEWDVFLGQDNITPDAAGEWGREIANGNWLELYNTPKAGTGAAITQTQSVIVLMGDDDNIQRAPVTATYYAAASGEFAANTLVIPSPYGNAVVPNGITKVTLIGFDVGE